MLALPVVIRVTLMLVSVTFPISWTNAAAASVAVILGLTILLARRRAIGQTTLVSAWWWATAALVAWSAVELARTLGLARAGNAELRFAAVTLSFCPIVALLGAKRPQHQAWNFVVVSLWAIVALPAAESLLLRRGTTIAVGEGRGWFLWILILLGPINFVPTRFWLSSLLLAAGQTAALANILPLLRGAIGEAFGVVGLLLAIAAVVVAWFVSRSKPRTANGYDRLWLDFRDSFGLLWGLRVQERVNALARQNGWDLELCWTGFKRHSSDDPVATIDAAIEPALRTSVKGLLRRFVTAEWIQQRLGSN